jgi:protein-disulfide isomerase
MICIIALIVFGFLGIFSASHRIIAKEAFECVFKRLTLRKCDTGLDKRLKAQITGKLMKKSPNIGRWMYKHFETLSWIFLIIFLISIFYTAQGAYFFIKYGNCNGENSDKFCIFDPLGTFGNKDASNICLDPNLVPSGNLIFAGTNIDSQPFTGPYDAPVTIIEFGCYSCPNTKSVVPAVNKMLEEYPAEVKLVYYDFPLPTHANSREAALAAKCVFLNRPEQFWDYHSKLFENQNDLSQERLFEIATEINFDRDILETCLEVNGSTSYVDEDYEIGLSSGLYGTPTFFIGSETLVGAVSFKDFKKIIDAELAVQQE